MSSIWYPTVDGVESAFEVSVDDPGHGVVHVRAIGDQLGLAGWETTLSGGQLGGWLTELTTRALCVSGEYESRFRIEERPVRRDGPPSWATTAVARDLLPAFQSAVLLAAAGTEKHERVMVDDEFEPPEVMCARCDVASPYANADATSAYCAEHGHRPFGYLWRSWDDAVEARGREVATWEFRRRMAGIGLGDGYFGRSA